MILFLKLMLVPSALLLATLAARYFGPSFAGWLAGLPIIAGPILWVVYLEQGPVFTAQAASAASVGVAATMCFSIGYAWASLRFHWSTSTLLGLLGWATGALVMSLLPHNPWLFLVIGVGSIWVTPYAFPKIPRIQPKTTLKEPELITRMLAGALLTFGVSFASHYLSEFWSGILTLFPLFSIVLAVFNQISYGRDFSLTLLRALCVGMMAVVAFCSALGFLLETLEPSQAFIGAIAVSLLIHWPNKYRIKKLASN